ncbi:hypothetical protein ACJMK2_033429, partial [Sinanodonta woodiana]
MTEPMKNMTPYTDEEKEEKLLSYPSPVEIKFYACPNEIRLATSGNPWKRIKSYFLGMLYPFMTFEEEAGKGNAFQKQ